MAEHMDGRSCLGCKFFGRLKPAVIFMMHPSWDSHNPCGAMTRYQMKALAFEVAQRTGHPLVLLQRIPVDCAHKNKFNGRFTQDKCPSMDENGNHKEGKCKELKEMLKYTRIDIRIEANEKSQDFRSVCSGIRSSVRPDAGEKYNDCRCFEQDSWAATYLLSKTEGERREAEGKMGTQVRVHEGVSPTCISYVCPHSGYTECAFLIEANGQSIVMVSGQFVVDYGESGQENIEKIIANMMVYSGIRKKKKAMDLIAQVKMSKTAFDEKIRTAFLPAIDTMLERINKSYEDRSDSFVSDKFEWLTTEVETPFERNVPFVKTEDQHSVEEQYEKLKGQVRFFIQNFAEQADISRCVCFLTEHLDPKRGTDLTNWVKEGGKAFRVKSDFFALNRRISGFVDMERVSGKKEYLPGSLMDEPSPFTHAVLAPVLENNFGMLILLRVEPLNMGLIETYRKFFVMISPVICGVALRLMYKQQSNFIEDFTREMRHELGQVNTGFLASIGTFEKRSSASQGNEYKKLLETFIKNARGYAHNTMLRTNMSRYIRGIGKANKSLFYPYSQFLYKWADIYQGPMQAANLKFIMYAQEQEHIRSLKVFKDAEAGRDVRPKMYADPDMIEQVAYNLTNNAWKYSIPGTTVSMDCRLNDEGDKYVLTVTNYGFPLKDESEYKKIFEYGYRGSNTTNVPLKQSPYVGRDSAGLGLALSKSIAESHGGELRLVPEKISGLCVPFFALYRELAKSTIFTELRGLYGKPDYEEDIRREEEKLKAKGCWGELNAIPLIAVEQKFVPPDILELIDREIVRYSFVMEIPYEEEGTRD